MKEVSFHSFELLRGDSRGNLDLPEPDELRWFQNEIKERWRDYRFYDDYFTSLMVSKIKNYLFELYIRTLREKRQIIPCYAGLTYGVLDARGDVYLCELLDKVGNIRDSDCNFEKIWKSEEANKQREFIRNKNCYCTHSCFQISNVLTNPGVWFDVLRTGI